jgi:glycosyl hydrolase family 26
VAGYQAWLGKSIPLVEIFGDRSTESGIEAPNWAIQPVTAAGKTVIIAWEFFIGGSNENWADAANVNDATSVAGVTYAQRYQAFGRNLVAQGQSHAIIRVATEFNNGSAGLPSVMDNATDINNYKLSFQGFVTTMRAVPGQHFTFDWDTSPDPGDPTDLTVAYPGDAYVDVIGLDDYVGPVPWGSNWTNDQEEWTRRLNGYDSGKGYQFYLNFATAHGKPVAFPEWGLGYYYSNNGATQSPPEEPYFIQQMYQLMSTHNVLFESFWEDGNGIYTSPPSIPLPNTKAMYKATFGSVQSSWP